MDSLKVEQITGVLLAGVWHDVLDRSFRKTRFSLDQTESSYIHHTPSGFTFIGSTREQVSGPISSVQAYRWDRDGGAPASEGA